MNEQPARYNPNPRCKCNDPEPHAIVHISGGIVQGVDSNMGIAVTVVDSGGDADDVNAVIEGVECWVYEEGTCAKTPIYDRIKSQIDESKP